MLCEMCGSDVASVVPVRVEGSVLRLCPSCARFGQAVASPPPPGIPRAPAGPIGGVQGGLTIRTRRMEERDLFAELPELELAPDWFHRIRTAREKLSWTPEEFGKRLNEKKSVVLKIEAGSFRPADASLRKIERLLKIRLTGEPSAAGP